MRYFSNLEFLPDAVDLGPSAAARNRRRWTVAAYVSFCLGIFARQLIPYPKVVVETANLRWESLLAAFIIGLALFPPIMRWLNRHRRKPGAEHVVSAFGYGFFVDLASAGAAALARVTHIIGG
jgi:hypothetical protein